MDHDRKTLSRRAVRWAAVLFAATPACSNESAAPDRGADSIHFAESGSPSTGGTDGSGVTASGTGSGGGSGEGVDGGEGGTRQVDDPCASLTAPGAPEARVVWVTGDDQSLDVTSPMSFLWSFQYAVRVPKGHANDYTLVHERCEIPAGESLSCSSIELPMRDTECTADHAPKFGLDPSEYKPGKNVYEFAMRLIRGATVESQDSFTIELTYTP
jgi:hypothetical protein